MEENIFKLYILGKQQERYTVDIKIGKLLQLNNNNNNSNNNKPN